jgi:hypothetical protein
MNANLNCPNNYLFHPELGWVLNQESNPLNGWPRKKVLASNPYNVPENDLYGRLYFYIVDRMKAFVKLVQSKRIFFKVTSENAVDLMKQMSGKAKFDRIDVSNISDSNYVGLNAILALSRPLMKEANPHATLITTLMNWTADTELAGFAGSFGTIR